MRPGLTLPGGTRVIRMIPHMFPALNMYYADPGQPLTTANEEKQKTPLWYTEALRYFIRVHRRAKVQYPAC